MKSLLVYKRLKRRFFFKQVWLGGVVSVLLMALVIGFNYVFEDASLFVRCFLYEYQSYVYVLFIITELIFSLLPPELYILILKSDTLGAYVFGVVLLSILSYLVAVVVYFFGKGIGKTAFFKGLVQRYFRRELRQIKRFGGLLIIIAALTPLSFTAVCMIIGATGFSLRPFLFYSAFRYLRFIIYGVIIWYAVSTQPPC